MRSLRPLGVFVVALLVACATPAPSATPSAPPTAASDPPSASPTQVPQSAAATGCLSLQEIDCLRVRDLVLQSLPAGSPPAAYVEVGPFACTTDPCLETILARPTGRVTVEFADGSEPAVIEVAVQADEFTARPAEESFLVSVPPASKKLPGPRATIMLGHCGLYSGIDVDGSFWNPIGAIDVNNPDTINATEAEFTLTTPATATLTTANGLALTLVRHPGAKHLPLCS
jgi:hypothetical protein